MVHDWLYILEGRRNDHDGFKQQFADADASRKQRPRLRRQEQHPGACYSSRFVPHISDKVISAYVESQHNSLDIEQEDWATEVSVKLWCFSHNITHFAHSNAYQNNYIPSLPSSLKNTVNMFGSFILGEQHFVFLYVCV